MTSRETLGERMSRRMTECIAASVIRGGPRNAYRRGHHSGGPKVTPRIMSGRAAARGRRREAPYTGEP